MAAPERAPLKSPIPHLWQIAATGDIDQLEEILGRGANLNASNPSGLTPLMVAAYHGRTEMVRALIKHGADANATDNGGLTAAMLADDAGHDEVVKILVGGAVKRKKTPSAPEAPPPQSAAGESSAAAAGAEISEPGPPSVRTLQEPPDIWEMVHETRSEFNAGSAFFGRLTRKHSIIAAVVLVIVGGAGALGYMILRRAPGGEPVVAQPPSKITNPVVRTASNTSPPGRDQRLSGRPARTATAIRSVFDLKTIIAGAVGLRETALFVPRDESRTASAPRPTVALFHADDKKKAQKSNPHLGNSPTVAAIEDRDRSQAPATKSDNDKRVNSPAGRREAVKLPTEPVSPPKPNPTPKGKVIQWP